MTDAAKKNLSSSLSEGQERAGSPTTPETVLAEIKLKASYQWAQVMDEASVNEAAYHGFQTYTDRAADAARSGESKKNVLRVLVGGYASSIVEGHPEHNAFPNAADAAAIKRAELANQYLRYWRHRQRFSVLDYELVENAELHGTGFYKVFWNPNLGESMTEQALDDNGLALLDADDNPVMNDLGKTGEVDAEIVTVFDFAYGPGHHIDDAVWGMHRRFVTEDEARALLHQHGRPTDSLPPEETFVDAQGTTTKGFSAWDLWYRPGHRFPKGLLVVALGEQILASVDYPYAHGRLPFVSWSPQPVRDSCFGTSHVFDNIHAQRALNHVEEKKDEILGAFGGVMLLMPRDLPQQQKEGSVVIEVENEREANLIQWKMMPSMPPLLDQRAAELEANMYDMAGQNEILSGQTNIKAGTSARSYEILARADGKKLAGPIARYREALYRRDWLALSTFQEKAHVGMKVSVFGEDQEPFVEVLSGVDVEGAEVMLVPVPGMENAPQAKASGASERAQAGMINPGDVPELSRTGLDRTLIGDQQRVQLRETFQQALQDNRQDLQPPQVDPQLALQELAMMQALPGVNVSKLQQWAAHYNQLLAQQAATQGGPQ